MNQETQKERLIHIMGTFDLATGHADTFDELLDSLESELRDVLGHYRAAVKEHLTQEPVAWVDPATLYRLKIGLEGVHLVYETEMVNSLPLYDKPQIESGCAECGVNGGHALYCVACAEKFVGGYKDSGVPAVETGLEQVSPDTPPQRTEQESVGDEWTPCMKLPVVVYVRKQRLGESHVSTREGITPVKPDDLIMRGVSGEEYPIGRAIFEQTYSLDTTPPQRTWVGLTDEEIDYINYTTAHMLAREVEAKLKELNT